MGRLGKQLLRGLREAAEMYGYKKEKLPWYKAAWEAFYFSKVYDIITEPYNIVRRFVNKCIKVAQFLPMVWNHEDWDSAYTLAFMHFLFKRMYAAIYVNGHHVEHPNDKRRLRIATELLRRMSNEHSYDDAHIEYMNKRFGETDYEFVKIKDPTTGREYTSMKDTLEDRLSESELKAYKKMKNYIYGEDLNNKMYKQDMELFCKILKKDSKKWWD